MRRESRFLVCPFLFPAFVPAMVQETCFGITRVLFHPYKLVANVTEVAFFMKYPGILSIERLTHIQAVKPHLVRIDLLVPEPTFISPGMAFQLASQQVYRFLVFF